MMLSTPNGGREPATGQVKSILPPAKSSEGIPLSGEIPLPVRTGQQQPVPRRYRCQRVRKRQRIYDSRAAQAGGTHGRLNAVQR
jgi:hypothetical protein